MNRIIPQILGFKLDTAVEKLRDEGIEVIRICLTKPINLSSPGSYKYRRGGEGASSSSINRERIPPPLRVIRQRMLSEEEMELVVSREIELNIE